MLDIRHVRVGAGLVNLGNTCFMNAVLQCMLYTPSLRGFITYYGSRLHHVHRRQSPFCLLCSLRAIACRCLERPQHTEAPRTLHTSLHEVMPAWRVGRQQDAHEFLMKVFEHATESLPDNQRRELDNLTMVELKTTVTCTQCKGVSSRTESTNHLSLTIQGSDISSCLATVKSTEVLHGSNMYDCSSCRKFTVATMQCGISKTSEVFIIQLKRFIRQPGRSIKCDKYVQYQHLLTMETTENCEPTQYELRAMVCHEGEVMEQGHYVAYVCDTRNWYRMDDHKVAQVSQHDAMLQKPYLLLYQRIKEGSTMHTNPSARLGVGNYPRGPTPEEMEIQQKEKKLLHLVLHNIRKECPTHLDKSVHSLVRQLRGLQYLNHKRCTDVHESASHKLASEDVLLCEKVTTSGKDNDVIGEVVMPPSSTLGTRKVAYTLLRGDLKTLQPRHWLNDQVVNAYCGLLAVQAGDKGCNAFLFDNHVTSRFRSIDISCAVNNYYRRVHLFEFDKWIVPLHLGVHWTMLIVDLKQKLFSYHDGMDCSSGLSDIARIIPQLMYRSYMEARHIKEYKKALSWGAWRIHLCWELPVQKNTYDCGVFALKMAECAVLGSAPVYNQESMPAIRQNIMCQLLKGITSTGGGSPISSATPALQPALNHAVSAPPTTILLQSNPRASSTLTPPSMSLEPRESSTPALSLQTSDPGVFPALTPPSMPPLEPRESPTLTPALPTSDPGAFSMLTPPSMPLEPRKSPMPTLSLPISDPGALSMLTSPSMPLEPGGSSTPTPSLLTPDPGAFSTLTSPSMPLEPRESSMPTLSLPTSDPGAFSIPTSPSMLMEPGESSTPILSSPTSDPGAFSMPIPPSMPLEPRESSTPTPSLPTSDPGAFFTLTPPSMPFEPRESSTPIPSLPTSDNGAFSPPNPPSMPLETRESSTPTPSSPTSDPGAFSTPSSLTSDPGAFSMPAPLSLSSKPGASSTQAPSSPTSDPGAFPMRTPSLPSSDSEAFSMCTPSLQPSDPASALQELSGSPIVPSISPPPPSLSTAFSPFTFPNSSSPATKYTSVTSAQSSGKCSPFGHLYFSRLAPIGTGVHLFPSNTQQASKHVSVRSVPSRNTSVKSRPHGYHSYCTTAPKTTATSAKIPLPRRIAHVKSRDNISLPTALDILNWKLTMPNSLASEVKGRSSKFFPKKSSNPPSMGLTAPSAPPIGILAKSRHIDQNFSSPFSTSTGVPPAPSHSNLTPGVPSAPSHSYPTAKFPSVLTAPSLKSPSVLSSLSSSTLPKSSPAGYLESSSLPAKPTNVPPSNSCPNFKPAGVRSALSSSTLSKSTLFSHPYSSSTALKASVSSHPASTGAPVKSCPLRATCSGSMVSSHFKYKDEPLPTDLDILTWKLHQNGPMSQTGGIERFAVKGVQPQDQKTPKQHQGFKQTNKSNATTPTCRITSSVPVPIIKDVIAWRKNVTKTCPQTKSSTLLPRLTQHFPQIRRVHSDATSETQSPILEAQLDPSPVYSHCFPAIEQPEVIPPDSLSRKHSPSLSEGSYSPPFPREHVKEQTPHLPLSFPGAVGSHTPRSNGHLEACSSQPSNLFSGPHNPQSLGCLPEPLLPSSPPSIPQKQSVISPGGLLCLSSTESLPSPGEWFSLSSPNSPPSSGQLFHPSSPVILTSPRHPLRLSSTRSPGESLHLSSPGETLHLSSPGEPLRLSSPTSPGERLRLSSPEEPLRLSSPTPPGERLRLSSPGERLRLSSPDILSSSGKWLRLSSPDSLLCLSSPDSLPSPGEQLHLLSPDSLPSPGALRLSSPKEWLRLPSPDSLPSHGEPLCLSSPDSQSSRGKRLRLSSPDSLPSPGEPLCLSSPDTLTFPGKRLRLSSLDSLPSPGEPLRLSSPDSLSSPGKRLRLSSPDSPPCSGEPLRLSSLDSLSSPGKRLRQSSPDSPPCSGEPLRLSSRDSLSSPGKRLRLSSPDSPPCSGEPLCVSSLDSLSFPGKWLRLSSPDSPPSPGAQLRLSSPDSPSSPEVLSGIFSDTQESLAPQCCLPFPNLPLTWYLNQGRLAEANQSRNARHRSAITEYHGLNLICLNRAQVTGSLLTNKEELQAKISKCTSSKVKHYQALLEVAETIIQKGPVLSTREVGGIYFEKKHGTSMASSTAAANIYDVLSKHLNIVQFYIHGRAYIMENTGSSITSLLETLEGMINKDRIVNEHLEQCIGGTFVREILEYVETPRDKQIIKGLLTKLTSIQQAAKLQGVKSRKGMRAAKAKLESGMVIFHDIRRTSQTVRSDMTNAQQHQLKRRIIRARRAKEIKVIADGRGRKLKIEQFPELALALEYAFGEGDIKERSGGGLESHPRLTTAVMYRGSDNVTTMRRAHEFIMSVAPPGFHISLSTCYNYTENYRQETHQAKRHHSGRGINAQVSLKMPSRTAVDRLVVNLHWTTANVNHIVDLGEKEGNTLVISKDAKAMVPADITPVQKPGRSWSRREHPDHTWDQSRVNAVTPMTFLFLKSKVREMSSLTEIQVPAATGSKFLKVTRTGQAVTLVNMAFFEPETSFKCMNEVLLLMSLPGIDQFFRDSKTGNIKKNFVFVVDNGPSEQPSSHLVQMCLARLIKFLDLSTVKQVSFAEYHSKRNYVERVHAVENEALNKHGPFSSTLVHKNPSVGSQEHRQNMESMCQQVQECISRASFGGMPLQCYRGIKQEDYIFCDEEELKTFLSLNEDQKEDFHDVYAPQRSKLLDELALLWNFNKDMKGKYLEDYHTITNKLPGVVTAWTDKYTTAIYNPKLQYEIERSEKQPLPDYIRWVLTKQLHYLPLEERLQLPAGVWDTVHGLFLPSVVLDLCLKVIPLPTDNIIHQMGLLTWLPFAEVKSYYEKSEQQEQDILRNDQEREKWKQVLLYKSNSKSDLEKLCKKLQVPVSASLSKHELVRLIFEKNREEPPVQPILYNGRLVTVPPSMMAIKKLPISTLRAIMHHHGFPTMGFKDELVMRVFLLRQGRSVDMFAREDKQIRDLVKIVDQLILQERKLYITMRSHTYRERKYSNKSKYNDDNKLELPPHIDTVGDLQMLFSPLLNHLDAVKETQSEHDKGALITPTSTEEHTGTEDCIRELMCTPGCIIKVKWSKDDVGNSGWKPSWYKAIVQSYDEESDCLVIVYPIEPGCIYTIDLAPSLSDGTVKLW